MVSQKIPFNFHIENYLIENNNLILKSHVLSFVVYHKNYNRKHKKAIFSIIGCYCTVSYFDYHILI